MKALTPAFHVKKRNLRVFMERGAWLHSREKNCGSRWEFLMKICWKEIDSVYLDLNKHLCQRAQTTFSPWSTDLRGRPTKRVGQNLRINCGGSLGRWGFVCRSLNFWENPSLHVLRRNHVSVGILPIPRSICAFLPHCCSFNQFFVRLLSFLSVLFIYSWRRVWPSG